MTGLTVNPTRMELTRFKGKLRTAQRGHKLLKDKRDELMRQFLSTVREARELRPVVEREMIEVQQTFCMAAAVMGWEQVEQALLCPEKHMEVTVQYRNVMSVRVPMCSIRDEAAGTWYPYGFAETSGELDDAINRAGRGMEKLLRLAELEQAAQLMAAELERTRRRVNALEYVVLPNTQETIRSIAMKLDEHDRGTIVRLLKVKDMIFREALEQRQAALDHTP